MCAKTNSGRSTLILLPMALEGLVSSPHRRTQNAFSSTLAKKQYAKGDEMESCAVLVQRHRFLLTALALLAFLCTIYLYFAITFGMRESCSGLTGREKSQCGLELAKHIGKGKMKFH